MALAADYPILDLFWTMVLLFGWVIYFWLLITVFADLFRRRDVSGWGKAGWTVFLLVLPLIGAFTYLITQNRSMTERAVREQETRRAETDAYIRSVAAPQYRGIDEIARAKDLLDKGAISADEFEQLKQRALV